MGHWVLVHIVSAFQMNRRYCREAIYIASVSIDYIIQRDTPTTILCAETSTAAFSRGERVVESNCAKANEKHEKDRDSSK